MILWFKSLKAFLSASSHHDPTMHVASLKSTFLLLIFSLLCGLQILYGQTQAGILFKLVDKERAIWEVEVSVEEGQAVVADKFAVYLADEWKAKHREGQSIAGRKIVVSDTVLIFHPILPFSEGLTYVATYPGLNTLTFTIPTQTYTPTTVVAIYPNRDTIPENILKMYLHFSAKMSVGKSYVNLCITNGAGDTIPLPFLDLDPELWNENGTRLTLWFDPGRIKRDLVPNQLLGAPLEQGQTYTLHISREWPDAAGHLLDRTFQKSFYVSEADRSTPLPDDWDIHTPAAQSVQPLMLQWEESLDEALLRRAFSVWDKEDQTITGNIELGQSQMSWSFSPHSPWKKGTYKIRIKSNLEDLAGNNLNRPFDRDLMKNPGETPDTPFYWLSFEVK